jgi:hypothetical protein
MENWEDDTDALLMQLPATGCVFRKTWYADGPQTATVSALDLVVPVTARNLKTTPRITEKIRDVFPHEITEQAAARLLPGHRPWAAEEEGRLGGKGRHAAPA